MKTFTSVALYWPNILDYFRLGLVLVGISLQDPLTNAILYTISHFLDLFDGKLARYLVLTSKCGIILGYTVDITTEIIWFFQLSAILPAWIPYFVIISIIDLFGLVLGVYNSASGSYWNSEPCALQKPFINSKGYTILGYTFVFLYQVYWAFLYLSVFYSGLEYILYLLFIPALCNFWSLCIILYDQLCRFRG